MNKVMEIFQLGAILLHSGSDSLTGDRLGFFNNTLKVHTLCVDLERVLGSKCFHVSRTDHVKAKMCSSEGHQVGFERKQAHWLPKSHQFIWKRFVTYEGFGSLEWRNLRGEAFC